MSRFIRKAPPAGFEFLEPTLDALEAELRERVSEPHEGKTKGESLWPVHQINWQKSKYVYDMYYKYRQIPRDVYDYCIDNKIVDAALIAKWKKPGYEKLCSTHAINSKNFKFETVSLCRVPRSQLPPGQQDVQDPTTGCMGCASGKGGRKNIFGNKYGQRLAAIQMARMAKEEEERKEEQEGRLNGESGKARSGGESDDEEGGPSSRSRIWAQADENADEGLNDGEGDDEEEEVGEDAANRAAKRTKR